MEYRKKIDDRKSTQKTSSLASISSTVLCNQDELIKSTTPLTSMIVLGKGVCSKRSLRSPFARGGVGQVATGFEAIR